MKINLFLIISITSLLLISCNNETFTPKPKGYFKIGLPEKTYHQLDKDCPFTFEVPDYCTLKTSTNNPENSCWFNIEFSNLNAVVYLSYKPVTENINTYLEDSRTLAFKHTVKAFDIEQKIIKKPDDKVYGIEYNILGNTASSYQFHLTDNENHFLRGSLYFNNIPNTDSIQPVLDFVKEDIDHIFKTFTWKNS